MTPEFTPRTEPLAVRAAAGVGPVARALEQWLLRADEATWGQLSLCAGAGVLVVTGPAELLPWVPGLVYLGSDVEAPGLLLPTTVTPSVHVRLLEQALRAHLSGAPGLLAVLPQARVVVHVDAGRQSSREQLVQWLEAP